jgi:hypothetical protein
MRTLGADCPVLSKSELSRDTLRAVINEVVSAGRSAGMPS